MTNTVITRFAPSPTGYLHVGGARTALFSYLFAQNAGGKFTLRIEDTDTERSTQESVDAIFEGLKWLDLTHDGEVVFQSKNLARYQEQIELLLNEDKAYHCHCSKQRLEEIREQQKAAGGKPRYDGHCRDLKLPRTENSIIRFKNPTKGEVSFDDHIRGSITISNAELDDLVIARADGMPTYNFSVVIDDADMGITHVVRGDDHINNTPRQINIYRALGLREPEFAHVPMILGDDGARLSKRHGAVSVMQYAEDGYLPEAVVNYLVRLGWSHGDQELFSKEEMIALFSLKAVNKAPSAFNKGKLDWINQQYMLQTDSQRLADLVSVRLQKIGVDVFENTPLTAIVELMRERAHTINELADVSLFLLTPLTEYDEKSVKKAFKASAAEPLESLLEACKELDQWEHEQLHTLIADVVDRLNVGFGKVGMPLRVALSGSAQGPANDKIMYILGQKETINRIEKALNYVQNELSS